MKKLFILFLLVGSVLQAQQGFNRGYFFGGGSTVLENLIVDNDTIIAIGVLHKEHDNRAGKIWAKFDTLGNLISMSHFLDSLGDRATYRLRTGVIKLSKNRGYAFMGFHFSRRKPNLYIVDRNGILKHKVEYSLLPNSKEYFIFFLHEVEGGFLMAGIREGLSGNVGDNLMIMKVGQNGEFQWMKILSSTYYNVELNSFKKIDENTFRLGGMIQLKYTYSWDKNNYIPYLMEIDSLGNKRWEWSLPPNDDDIGINEFHQRADSGWVYASARKVVTGAGPAEFDYQAKIVSRNKKFELEWEQNIFNEVLAGLQGLRPTPDGNYVVFGSDYFVDYTLLQGGYLGTTRKFTPSGDSIWQRNDTIGSYLLDNGFRRYEAIYGGLDFLSSGSIIACGYNAIQHLNYYRHMAWLVKISPDGCIDTLNCIPGVVGTNEEIPMWQEMSQLTIFPNPAHHSIQIYLSNTSSTQSHQIKIIDMTGKVVQEKTAYFSENRVELDISRHPSGIYFVQVFGERGGLMGSGRWVKW